MSFEEPTVEVSPEYQEELEEKNLEIIRVTKEVTKEIERLKTLKERVKEQQIGTGIENVVDIPPQVIGILAKDYKKFGQYTKVDELIEAIGDEIVRLDFMQEEIKKGNIDIAEDLVNELVEE